MGAAAPGAALGYAVINAGELPIIVGEAYGLESLADDGWERIELPFMFRLWGRRLAPGDRYELSARLPDLLQPGRFRLSKRLDIDRDPHPGYEWLGREEIRPIQVTAELDVADWR